MTRDDLEVFLAIYRGNSIKAAARALNIDHSTVSRRLAALELELATTLFERSFQGLVPTDAGQAIEPLARDIETQMVQLKSVALAASASLEGTVVLAASPVVAEGFLAPRIATLGRRFPEIDFELSAGVQRVDITRREADLAIRAHPQGVEPAAGSAIARKVARFGLAAFASKEYVERCGLPERPIRDLSGHQLIVAFKGSPGAKWNAELDTPAEVSLVAFPYATMIAAAARSHGLAVLPCIAGDQHPDLVRVSEVVQTWNLYLVCSDQARSNRRVSAVMDAIIEMIAAEEALFAGQE